MPPLRAISKVAFLVQRVPPAKSVMLTFITFLGQNGTCQNSFDTNAGPGLVFDIRLIGRCIMVNLKPLQKNNVTIEWNKEN